MKASVFGFFNILWPVLSIRQLSLLMLQILGRSFIICDYILVIESVRGEWEWEWEGGVLGFPTDMCLPSNYRCPS